MSEKVPICDIAYPWRFDSAFLPEYHSTAAVVLKSPLNQIIMTPSIEMSSVELGSEKYNARAVMHLFYRDSKYVYMMGYNVESFIF